MKYNDIVAYFVKFIVFYENKIFKLRKNNFIWKCLKMTNKVLKESQDFVIKIECQLMWFKTIKTW